MSSAFNTLSRIWNSVKFLSNTICRKIVWGTGRVAEGVGVIISNIMAILIMACIVVLLGAVSISYGIFSKTQDHTHCDICGQTDVNLVMQPDGSTVCERCA